MRDKNKIWVDHFFHKIAPALSFTLLVISIILFTREVLAVTPSPIQTAGTTTTTVAPTPAPTPQSVGTSTTISSSPTPPPSYVPGQTASTTRSPEQSGKTIFVSPPTGSFQPPRNTSISADRLKALGLARLNDNKLKICQTRSDAILSRSKNLITLINKQYASIGGVAQGVEDYYQKTLSSQGITVSNYNTLVSDITTKQNIFLSAIKASQDDIDNFKCSADNPTGLLTQFKSDTQATYSSLQAYKESVRNLVSAVKLAAQTSTK